MAQVPLTVQLDRADDEAGLDYVVELANIQIRAANAVPDSPQVPEFNRQTYLEHRLSIVIASYKKQYLDALAQRLARKYIAADAANRMEADDALADVVVPEVGVGAGGGGGGSGEVKL